MRKIIFLLIPLFLYAQDENYNISADLLNFKKNNLHFENGFFLEHSFGKIYANSARFSNLKKANKLVDFNLKNGVKLITNTNGTLISDNADFDAFSSKIRFYSQDIVTYLDKIKKRDLKITSNEVKCLLNTKSAIKSLNIEDIYSISFLDNVILTLDNKINIFSNIALFEKTESSSNIFLYPKDGDFCHFTYENSEIFAKKAKLDVTTLDLILENTKGQINNVTKKQSSISFVADKLFWRNFENSFSLNDNVKVIDPEFGEIYSNQIEIIKKINQKAIRKIISRNNTTINFFSKNKTYLFTEGIIELDHEKKRISAFSLKNQNHYLVYVDENVSISAKKATLIYNADESVENIILENDVRFKYNQNDLVGYGSADKIDYSPQNKKIILLSDKDKKVLFWQEDNSLHLSAKEIHINPKEKNDIKGLGDVRFTFNFEEENLIHKIFSKYTNYE